MYMLWSLTKQAHRPLHPELQDTWDWPNTISFLISLRMRYDSYLELPEVPPEEHWDFPILIKRHIESLYPGSKKTVADISIEDIEG